MQLRPYQLLLMDDLHRVARDRPIAVMPTGAGKSVVGGEIGYRVRHHGKKLLWVVHRRELVEQAVDHLERRDLDVGVILGGESARPDAPVQVASIQTLANRPTPEADVMVYDEVHHSVAPSNKKVLDRPEVRKMLWVGLTATPARLDNRGLGEAGWGALVQGPSIRELIATGFLSPYKVFAPPGPDMKGVGKTGGDYARGKSAERMKIVGDPVDLYRTLLTDGRAIAFGCTREHSIWARDKFLASGIPALHLDARNSIEERKDGVAAFREGDVKILLNVGLFDEGFDTPFCDGVIDMAPTCSLVRARQKWGRALRVAEGKEIAIILDMAGNWSRVGLPDDHIEWSLEGKAKGSGEKTPWKTCKACWGIIPVLATACPLCEAPCLPEKRKAVRHQRGRLTEIQSSYGASNGTERSMRDRREVYWTCLVNARGRGWKMKQARSEYKRRTGHWVSKNETGLEDEARRGCQHTTMQGGFCRFCNAAGGLLEGLV